MNGPDRHSYRALRRVELLSSPAGSDVAGDPNRPLLASLIAGQRAGDGILPPDLGLGEAAFTALCRHYFPDLRLHVSPARVESIPEWEELYQLLMRHPAPDAPFATAFAAIIATACAGRDHLWQDLGLANRGELSQLMAVNFPVLAEANARAGDMKWKKFLYRQFCADEGIYVCPAPSCGQCHDFAQCFGQEI